MSQNRRSWAAFLVALVLLPAGAAIADDQCPGGAVNTITGNYVGIPAEISTGAIPRGGSVSGSDSYPAGKCEICVFVRVQAADNEWEDVGRVCGIWSDEQAYDVMFKIGRCGLILPSSETAGKFYGTSVPIRAHAERMPPCL